MNFILKSNWIALNWRKIHYQKHLHGIHVKHQGIRIVFPPELVIQNIKDIFVDFILLTQWQDNFFRICCLFVLNIFSQSLLLLVWGWCQEFLDKVSPNYFSYSWSKLWFRWGQGTSSAWLVWRNSDGWCRWCWGCKRWGDWRVCSQITHCCLF